MSETQEATEKVTEARYTEWLHAMAEPTMVNRVEKMRRKMDISKSELVRRAVEAYLKKNENRR
jgi:hypothetical protein